MLLETRSNGLPLTTSFGPLSGLLNSEHPFFGIIWLRNKRRGLMMKWQFKENKNQNDLMLTIEKAHYDKQVSELVDYLEAFQSMKTDVVAVKSDDHIYLLKMDEIIALEVDGDYLLVMTKEKTFRMRERLYKMKDRLPSDHFVQVSKQSLINLDHLQMMEASFSGNMLAILTNKTKIIISRRYLKNLEEKLGL